MHKIPDSLLPRMLLVMLPHKETLSQKALSSAPKQNPIFFLKKWSFVGLLHGPTFQLMIFRYKSYELMTT